MSNKVTSNTEVVAIHTGIKAGNLYENTAGKTAGCKYIVYQTPRDSEGVTKFALVSLITGKNFLLLREDIEGIFGDNSDGNGGHGNFERISGASIETDYVKKEVLS